MDFEELQKNYDGVYRMWHGVPILVMWDKLEPKKPCNECGHAAPSHKPECVFHGQR